MDVRSTAFWCMEMCLVNTGLRLAQGPANTGFTIPTFFFQRQKHNTTECQYLLMGDSDGKPGIDREWDGKREEAAWDGNGASGDLGGGGSDAGCISSTLNCSIDNITITSIILITQQLGQETQWREGIPQIHIATAHRLQTHTGQCQ